MTAFPDGADRSDRRAEPAHPPLPNHPPHRIPLFGVGDQFIRPRLPDAAATPPRQRCLSHELQHRPASPPTAPPAETPTATSARISISPSAHRTLTVTSRSVVEVDPPPPGAVRRRIGPRRGRPPARSGLGWRAGDRVHPRPADPRRSPMTVREYAAAEFRARTPAGRGADATSTRVSTPTSPTGPARRRCPPGSARCSAAREGVCQDFARLAIACLRANGLAASYVSGYLATDPPPGKERMVGIDATHAWAAVWHAAERVAGVGSDQRPNGRRALHRRRLGSRLCGCAAAARHHLHGFSRQQCRSMSCRATCRDRFDGGVLHA